MESIKVLERHLDFSSWDHCLAGDYPSSGYLLGLVGMSLDCPRPTLLTNHLNSSPKGDAVLYGFRG